ncbi:MAG TPA: hypothetical protein VFT22_11030 [Kofleriaceae bacterium]|nr:hypothetical protein [Kofleriaceae bacterium]
MSELSDFTTEQLTAELERRHRDSVMTVKQMCDALRQWAACIKATEPVHGYKHGQSFAGHLDDIFLAISKSYLCGRLLYAKQKVRTKKCPIHNGHWEGQAMLMGNCPHECDGSGWLREP